MAAPMRIFRFARSICSHKNLVGNYTLRVKPTVVATQTYVRKVSQSHPLFVESIPASEIKKRMEALTDKFTEARELLEDARESMGTVYFSEDMEEAKTAVEETLDEYRNLLDSLSDVQKQEVISTIGLRMEELKAQKAAIEETH